MATSKGKNFKNLEKEANPKKENPLSQLISQLGQYWEKHYINSDLTSQYLEAFEKISIEKSTELINQEINNFKAKKSYISLCVKSIKHREESIKSLEEMNTFLQEADDWEKNQTILTQCAEVLNSHRMITLSTIENLINWVSMFYYYTKSVPKFTYKRLDYLDKIQNDSDFNQLIEMKKVFVFSSQSDPFLLSTATPVLTKLKNSTNNYFIRNNKISIPVPEAAMNRISEAQKFLISKEVSEKMLVSIVKRLDLPKGQEKQMARMLEIFPNELLDIIIDCYAGPVLNQIANDVSVEAIGKSILFKYLDFSKSLKEIVSSSIFDIQNKVKNEGKNSKSAAQKIGLNEIEESKIKGKNKESPSNNYRQKTRPSLTIIKDISPQKLIRQNKSIKITEPKISPSNRSFDSKKSQGGSVFKKKLKLKYLTYDTDNELIESYEDQIKTIIQVNKSTKGVASIIPENLEKSKKNLFSDNKRNSSNLKERIIPVNEDSTSLKLDLKKYSHSKIFNLNTSQDLKDQKSPPIKDSIRFKVKLNPLISPGHIQATKNPLTPTEIKLQKRPENLNNLSTLVILEGIFRNYLEVIIKEAKLSNLAESCITDLASSQSSVQSSISTWKIQKFLYKNLIKSFTSQPWLSELATNTLSFSQSPLRSRINSIENSLIQEPEDYTSEVFTPGVHSPNLVLSKINSISELSEKSVEIPSTLNLIPQQSSFQLVKSSSTTILKEFSEYFKQLPHPWQEACLEVEKTMALGYSFEDFSFLWSIEGGSVKGCLVHCTVQEGNMKNALVLHLSVQNDFKNFIHAAIRYFQSYSFNSVVFQFRKIPKELDKSLAEIGLEKVSSSELKVRFGDIGLGSWKNRLNFSLATSESERVLVGYSEENKSMIEYGSRAFLAYHILAILKENKSLEYINEVTQIRLQQEVKDSIEILNTEERVLIDNIKRKNSEIFKKSESELQFNWTGMSHLDCTLGPKRFLFWKFHNSYFTKNDSLSMYFVKTSNPVIDVAFIHYPDAYRELGSAMRGLKTDLFWKVENLLQNKDLKPLNGGLCVPAFNKKINWEMNWMKGFQTKYDGDLFFNSCVEKFSWIYVVPDKIHNSDDGTAKFWIKEDFIAAVIQKNIRDLLDVPLAVALVRSSDWVEYNY